MLENLRRIFITAAISFKRNAMLSTATVLVMTLTLFVMGGLLLSSVLMNTILDSLETKIDVSVYFFPNAPESLVLDLKKVFEKIPNVNTVAYVSQAQALEDFKTRHKDNPTINEALKELEENPLEASLNITAADPSKFREIVAAIEARKESSIDKINFYENQTVIERLTRIMDAVRKTGAALAAVLALIAVLVAFNTVRLAIFTSRDEIQVMRLVGATSRYIRLPFLAEGVMDGAISAALATLLFLPITWFLSPRVKLFVDADLFAYFRGNFFEFFFILLAAGAALGALSSFLAMRKYLRV